MEYAGLLTLAGGRVGRFPATNTTFAVIFTPDVTHARSHARRRQLVDASYIVGSIVIYGAIWLARD